MDDEKIPLCPTCYRRKGIDQGAVWEEDLQEWVCPKCGSYV